MYIAASHRRATRWPRRFVFALAILLLLVFGWRFCRAWQAAQPQAPQPLGRAA